MRVDLCVPPFVMRVPCCVSVLLCVVAEAFGTAGAELTAVAPKRAGRREWLWNACGAGTAHTHVHAQSVDFVG